MRYWEFFAFLFCLIFLIASCVLCHFFWSYLVFFLIASLFLDCICKAELSRHIWNGKKGVVEPRLNWQFFLITSNSCSRRLLLLFFFIIMRLIMMMMIFRAGRAFLLCWVKTSSPKFGRCGSRLWWWSFGPNSSSIHFHHGDQKSQRSQGSRIAPLSVFERRYTSYR